MRICYEFQLSHYHAEQREIEWCAHCKWNKLYEICIWKSISLSAWRISWLYDLVIRDVVLEIDG